MLTRYGMKGKRETVLPNVSKETLAELIGTMVSRANFFMKQFKKLGLIGYNRGLHIKPSLLRVVLHDQPTGPQGLPKKLKGGFNEVQERED